MEAVKDEAINTFQLEKVLHMTAGNGDHSYASHSLLQKKAMIKAQPVLKETIEELYNKTFPESIVMADMGCSSGPTALLPTWNVIEAIHESCNLSNKKPPVLQVFLNDLPGNDFNSIFNSLPSFYEKIDAEKGREIGSSCFIAAMPGNFYGPLFQPQSLHFVHSSYALHWFSEVPKFPLNKGNIYLAKTSPPAVHKAYHDQFQRDFKTFLKARSEEVIAGGRMVFILYGRGDQSDRHSPSIWELVGITLTDLVLEGLLEESKLDSFNCPFYGASAEEVKNAIESEGSFYINRLESFQIPWDANIDDRYKDTMDKYTRGMHVANRLRSVSESFLTKHFGSEIIDVMFERFSVSIGEYMEKENGAYTNHVVSMTRK